MNKFFFRVSGSFFALALFFSVFNLLGVVVYDSNLSYPGGSVITYEDKFFEAKWWANPGQSPAEVFTVANEWETPWKEISAEQIEESPTLEEETGEQENETSTENLNINNYDPNLSYPGGSVVMYEDKLFEAKWWANSGQSPAAVFTVANEWETPWKEISAEQVEEQAEPEDTTEQTGETNESSTDSTDIDLSNSGQEFLPNHLFAPFVDATLYPTPRIADIAEVTGVKHFILSFIVSDPSNPGTASWGGYYNLEVGPNSWDSQLNRNYYLYEEIERLRQLGGDIIISLGGAAGTPLAVATQSVEQLVNEYKHIVQHFNLHHLDFDIEGAAVADPASIDRRSQAIALLQEEYPDLKIWYTLPVLPQGLTHDGIAVIESALNFGVQLDGVNVMAMDYGDSAAPNPEGRMGQYAIDAITALHGQLKNIYAQYEQTVSDQDLWKMIGVTPMIGLNDVLSERFHLSDAQQLLNFALEKEIGLIGMWSVNRDHPCPDKTQVELTCSSIIDQTESYQFMQTFKVFTQ